SVVAWGGAVKESLGRTSGSLAIFAFARAGTLVKVVDVVADVRMSRLRQSLLQGLQTLTGWIQHLRDGYSGIQRGLLQVGHRHVVARGKEAFEALPVPKFLRGPHGIGTEQWMEKGSLYENVLGSQLPFRCPTLEELDGLACRGAVATGSKPYRRFAGVAVDCGIVRAPVARIGGH